MERRNPLFTRRLSAICVVAIVMATLAALPKQLQAQTGENVVLKGASTPAASPAFIDASVFANSTNDICVDIYDALSLINTSGPVGAVIDARGINTNNSKSTGGTSPHMECTDVSGGTPWYQGGVLLKPQATILLPPGIIDINTTWVIPDHTRVVGAAMNSHGQPSATQGNGTSLGWTGSTGTMMEMGGLQGTTQVCPLVNSVYVCTGVSIEDLYLYGSGHNVVGIENDFAQDFSYVNHVSLDSIGGTGLVVKANYSGPYSNLVCTTTETSGSSYSMACVELEASDTLGLHGMTATVSISNPPTQQPAVAIYLDGDNNSVEDIHIEGFADGILVGQNGDGDNNTLGNTLVGINAADGAGNVTNAIHICGSNVPSGGTACTPDTNTVADLSILGAMSVHTVNTIKATIEDDVNGTLLKQQGNYTSVGSYWLGEELSVGTPNGYSRFTTNPLPDTTAPENTPTWMVGSGTVSGTCTSPGSLYINSSGSSGSILYVCVSGSLGWQPLA